MTDSGSNRDYSAFLKCLRLTTSDNDAEALAAIRMANKLLAKFAKGDWEAFLSGRIKIVADPFSAVPNLAPSAPSPAPTPPAPRPTPAAYNPYSRPSQQTARPTARPQNGGAPASPSALGRPFDIDDTIPVGKHKGKTIRQLLQTEIGYIKWMQRDIPGFCLSPRAQREHDQIRRSPTLDVL